VSGPYVVSSVAGSTPDDRAPLLELYQSMLTIRRVEDTIQELFLKGEIYGTTHLCSGQEAVPVGVSSVLREGDRVAGTYRGHGHALALGVPVQALLDELLGRATGINGGRSGSMNVNSLEHGLIGSFGIVGGSIAAATGAALALRRRGGVAVAYFGDGATNQGYFHECLNFASAFTLPVLFVCENNLYGEYTLTECVSGGTICARAEALGVQAVQVDGMAVWDVRDAAGEAVARARDGGGPTMIEALTYRFVGHSRSDPAKYRRAGELDAWKERDPLKLCRDRLELRGASPAELDEIGRAVDELIAEARVRGLSAPWPDAADLPTEFKSGTTA
jgi:acetoin:2,6-dichlorophenolindophenol oxidoreductase subunit alpha